MSGRPARPKSGTNGAPSHSGTSPLRLALEATGLPLKDVTVLSPQNDPFRVDTAARHRDGAWLAMQAKHLGLTERKIHLRGLHYAVIGQPKPDGTPYTNDDANWVWLSEHCAKARAGSGIWVSTRSMMLVTPRR